MVMRFFQNLGKSLMLPVAVLPVAAIMVGIGNWLFAMLGAENVVAMFFYTAGIAIIGNLGLLFCIGVSIGMAKKSDGTSALSGLVSWLIVQLILAPDTIGVLFNKMATDPETGKLIPDIASIDPAFAKTENVFIGIGCGLIAAVCYNKFKDTKLPDALSFFSGKRSVAIVTGLASCIFALILMFVWPIVFGALVSFGEAIVGLGAVGAGIYGFFNRMLIPFGLHHALNSVFWFDVAGINDLGNYQTGDGVFGVTGQYMTGFFPVMMFGIPGAALAMYHTAKSNKKKIVAGLMLSGAFAAFLTGITEPIEFAFMFLAPALYAIHAVIMGIVMAICVILPVRAGFSFSGGLIDLVLGWQSPMAENPWIIFIIGPIVFGLYYAIFRFVITKFKLKTPGREDDDEANESDEDNISSGNFIAIAARVIEGLGGKGNIAEIDNCVTRLRMQVTDVSLIDDALLKKAGAKGVMKPGGGAVQVIIGTQVQFVRDAIDKIIEGRVNATEIATALAKSDGKSDATPTTTDTNETEAPENSEIITLNKPFAGDVLELCDVPDQTFATGIMGPGRALRPTASNIVTAPADGTVAQIFDTGHAVALELEDGVQLLIHVGIDTVNLKGDGFEKFVATGDKVKTGDKLLSFDLGKIKAAGYSEITPIILLNRPNARLELK